MQQDTDPRLQISFLLNSGSFPTHSLLPINSFSCTPEGRNKSKGNGTTWKQTQKEVYHKDKKYRFHLYETRGGGVEHESSGTSIGRRPGQEQKATLNLFFDINPKPDSMTKAKLSEILRLSPRSVNIW